MAPFPFELVSPQRLVFSGAAEQVDVPGAEGDFGVLTGHAPLVSTLRPGILTIRSGGGAKRFFVRDGFAEVNAKGLTVLAEIAIAIEELDVTELANEIETTERRIADAKESAARDKAVQRLDQLRMFQGELRDLKSAVH